MYKTFIITQEEENRRYILRNSDFTMPRFNTVKYGRHSLKYLGPFLWCRLVLTKDKNSLSTFKCCIHREKRFDKCNFRWGMYKLSVMK